jgi:hypothetical protein
MAAVATATGIGGFDCRVDEDGLSHPWRMVAWMPAADGDVVVRAIGALPDGRRWLSVPRDALYGDLLALDRPPLGTRVEEIADELAQAGMGALLVADETCAVALFDGLRRRGIGIVEVKGYSEKAAQAAALEPGPRAEFPGEAGREIAIIRHVTGGIA